MIKPITKVEENKRIIRLMHEYFSDIKEVKDLFEKFREIYLKTYLGIQCRNYSYIEFDKLDDAAQSVIHCIYAMKSEMREEFEIMTTSEVKEND